jgi:hypothetical protein
MTIFKSIGPLLKAQHEFLKICSSPKYADIEGYILNSYLMKQLQNMVCCKF